MNKENIFPVSAQVWVRFIYDGAILRDIPFKYTVKHAKHWGLMRKAFRYNGTRRLATPINAHFDRYAGVMANILLGYLHDYDWISVQVVGASFSERGQEDLYGAKSLNRFLLRNIERKYGPQAFYVVKSMMHDTLRIGLTSFISTYIRYAGYEPQKKPRKYLHENRKEWCRYKGLTEAIVTKREAYINLDRMYNGSLLDIKILPEVLKHANNLHVYWSVNTPEQALEAKLLHPNCSVNVRRGEFEELEL
jgi:hypothetical protein